MIPFCRHLGGGGSGAREPAGSVPNSSSFSSSAKRQQHQHQVQHQVQVSPPQQQQQVPSAVRLHTCLSPRRSNSCCFTSSTAVDSSGGSGGGTVDAENSCTNRAKNAEGVPLLRSGTEHDFVY